MKVFISHSSRDTWIAKKISDDLNRMGVETFLDEKDLEAGARFDEKINENLKQCDEFLVLLSPASVSSPWVLIEVGGARVLGKHLVPVLLHLGANDIPDPISKNLAIDLNKIEKYYLQIRERLAHGRRHRPPQPRRAPQPLKPLPADPKVGDRVRLPPKPPPPIETDEIYFEWEDMMNHYLGQTATVVEVDTDRSLKLDIDHGENWFACDWVTKI